MKLKSQLLLYLDKRFILHEMRSACERFMYELTENIVAKFPPLRFLLEIDVIDLCDLQPELGVWLLEEPIKFQKASSEILFACLQTLNNEKKPVEKAQVAANIRLRCVSRILVPSNPRYYTGLTQFYSLLISVSKPEGYVYHTVWSCPEECEGNEVIVHYIPKVPPKCYICKSVLFENSGLRQCGEKVTAIFKVNSLMSQSFLIVDDLIPKLKLGAKYNIHAVSVKKATIVWSLEEITPLRAPLTSSMPGDIADLYKVCKGISWQFIYCLASSIGIGICPLSCFMQLKIYLLLSLTSIKANAQTGSNIIHVLAAGFDTGYVGRLMEKAAELADKAVFLGTTNTSASVALIGSSGGVCVLPLPLHVYNQKQTSAILSSIETGDIVTETNNAKVRGAVWTQGMDFKKLVLMNIASVFGTVCRGDFGDYNDEIVDFVLESAVEPQDTSKDEVEALKDVKVYIELVAGVDVSLDSQTEKLLRIYFLTARRERPRAVTSSCMNALVAMCLNSARLCRRTVANVDDAVFAIWLHVCGSPEPRFAPEEYLQTPSDVKKLQNIMINFKDWLEQFTGSGIS